VRLYTLLFLSLISVTLSGQVDNIIDENDPYSLFGVGELRETLPVKSRAMGGIGIAFNDANRLNISNPASLAWLQRTTFQAGLFVKNNWLSDETAATSDLGSTQSGNVSMAYVSLGFPIWRNYIGSAFSLQPYSRVSYDLTDQFLNTGVIDSTEYFYKGVGDIYSLSWSNGFKYKGLAAGVGAHYHFGSIDKSTIAFTDEENFFGVRNSNTTNLSGLAFDAGLLYSHKFLSKEKDEEGESLPAKNTTVNIGARYKLGSNIDASLDSYYERVQQSGAGIILPYDTILEVNLDDGEIVLPSELGLGFTVRRGIGFLAGADYALYNGSEYRYFGVEDSLQNASKISVGLQINPSGFSKTKKYFGQVNYRFGTYYYTNHLRLFGEDIPEYGISFGVGLPIRPDRNNYLNPERSELDISFVFGQKGQAVSPLIKENFFKVSIGFNLNALWFVKPKID